jgi:hypothetical protein
MLVALGDARATKIRVARCPSSHERLRRSQSPYRVSRSMDYENKGQSYGDSGASSGGRRARKTRTASRRAQFNGVVEATEFARVKECMGKPGSPTEANRRERRCTGSCTTSSPLKKLAMAMAS